MIISEITKVVYTGNGTQTVFDVPFSILQKTDLTLELTFLASGLVTNVNLALFDWTELDDENHTGQVLYPNNGSAAVTSSYTLTVRRQVEYVQELSLANSRTFNPDEIETQLDKIVMQTSQLAQEITDVEARLATGVVVTTVIPMLTVAALRLFTGSVDAATFIETTSYWPLASYADGVAKGGARYRYDPNVVSADNDVTVIVDAIARRWVLVTDGVVETAQAGCKCDEVNDDLIYYNKLITRLNISTSGVSTIRHSKGHMKLSAVPTAITSNAFNLDGYGGASIISMLASTAASTFITLGETGNAATEAWIHDFYIDAAINEANITGALPAINCLRITSAFIDRVRIKGGSALICFGGDNAGETATRVKVNDCNWTPTIKAGSAAVRLKSSTGCGIKGGYLSDAQSAADSKVFYIKSVAAGEGIDNFMVEGLGSNFNGSDINYFCYTDVSEKGVSNIYFSNSVLDGGAIASFYFKINAGLDAISSRRIHNFFVNDNRIFSGLAGGGGATVVVDWQSNNVLQGLNFTGNNLGTSHVLQMTRGTGVALDFMHASFVGNTIVNTDTNGGAIFEYDCDKIAIIGNSVTHMTEDNVLRFAEFVKLGANVTRCHIVANEFSECTAADPINTSNVLTDPTGADFIIMGNTGNSSSLVAHTHPVADLSNASANAKTFLQATNYSAMRTALGLGTLATQNGTISGTNTGDETAAGIKAKLLALDLYPYALSNHQHKQSAMNWAETDNLVRDANYLDSGSWVFGTGWGVTTNTTARTALKRAGVIATEAGNATTTQLNTATVQAAPISYFAADHNTTLNVSWESFVPAGFTGQLYIQVWEYDYNGVFISFTNINSTDYRTVAAAANTTNKNNAEVTVSSTTAACRILLRISWSTTLNNSGNGYFGKVEVLRKPIRNGFTSRASLATALAGGLVGIDGTDVFAQSREYNWQTGATVMSDLPGLVPVYPVTPQHFGATDNSTTSTSVTSVEGVNEALNGGYSLYFPKGSYALAGGSQLHSNTGWIASPDAVMYQTDFSAAGGLLTNADKSIAGMANATSLITRTDNTVTQNVNLSGANYPRIINATLGSQAAATTTTLILPATDSTGVAISSVDDFYNGWLVEVFGGLTSGYYSISNYVGATRTVTVSEVWAGEQPASGHTVNMGYNDLGLGVGSGARMHKDWGGLASDWNYLKFVPYQMGGKGINTEQGIDDFLSIGRTFRNCGQAYFAQGTAGWLKNGAWRGVTNSRVGYYYAENCGSVLTVSGHLSSTVAIIGCTIDDATHATFTWTDPYPLISIVKTTATTLTITYSGSDLYVNGGQIRFYDVLGMTELNYSTSGVTYTISSVNIAANTFVVTTVTNTAWGAHTAGSGHAFRTPLENGMLLYLNSVNAAWDQDLEGLHGVVTELNNNAHTFRFVTDTTSWTGVGACTATADSTADGKANITTVIASNIQYKNCGHNAYRQVGSDHVKSGIINLEHAQSAIITSVQGWNETTYPSTSPGYPTTSGRAIGYTLTGNVGALIYGTGWSVTIRDVHHVGNLDSVVTLARNRALGQDGMADKEYLKAKNLDFMGLRVNGAVTTVIDTHPDPNHRPSNNNTTGYIQCTVGSATNLVSEEFLDSIIYDGETAPFVAGELITGGTSGATAVVQGYGYQQFIYYDTWTADFTPGKTISGSLSGASAKIYAVTETVANSTGILYLTRVAGRFKDGDILTELAGSGGATVRTNSTKQNVLLIKGLVGRFVNNDVLTGSIAGAANIYEDGTSYRAAYKNLTVDITEMDTGKRIIGTPQQIIQSGNTFARLTDKFLDLRRGWHVWLLGDDAVSWFEPPSVSGAFMFSTDNSTLTTICVFRTISTTQLTSFTAPSTLVLDATSGRLTNGAAVPTATYTAPGTAGTDVKLNIRCELQNTIYLPYDTQTGVFTVGQVVTGATSGAVGTIVVDTDLGTYGVLELKAVVGTFKNNEIITDPVTGSASTDIPSGMPTLYPNGRIFIKNRLGTNTGFTLKFL